MKNRKRAFRCRMRIGIVAAFLWTLAAVHPVFAATEDSPPQPPGASAEAVMPKVRVLVSQREYAQALALLRPYTDQPEAFPTFYSDYLVILTWAGLSGEAIGRFEVLPLAFPRRSYLLRNIAKAYYDQGDFATAAALYRDAFAKAPEDHTALEGWLTALMAGEDPEQAEQVLEKKAGAAGESLRFQLLRARLLFHRECFMAALVLYDTLMAAQPLKATQIAKMRDDLVAGFSIDQQTRLLAALKAEAESVRPDGPAAQYYALCLVLTRRYPEAVEYLDTMRWDAAAVPSDRLYWFAWANFKAGRPQRAQEGFDLLLVRDGHRLRARIGRTYCRAAMSDFARAQDEITALRARYPEDAELLYAQAHVFEKQGRFWDAACIYERILERTPDDRTAQRYRLRALADLGATSVAAWQAERVLPADGHFREMARQDSARDHIRWEEHQDAVRLLAPLTDSGECYAFDYIVASTRAGQYAQAVEAYEGVVASGGMPPDWVQVAAAGAYLAEGDPQKALGLYDQVLADQPTSEDAQMGKFYALQTLRRWKEADAWLDRMDGATPDTIAVDGRAKSNPAKFDLALVRAWYAAHQDRLAEAESMFLALQAQAPANLDVRNGLAHIYLWRGWPRQSLNAFNIISNLSPSYDPAQTGRAMALNQLAEKTSARILAADLLEQKPHDKNAQRTRRTLMVEQMYEWRTDLHAQYEDDDSYDTRIRTEFSAPLTLHTRVFGFVLWRRTWFDRGSDPAAYFRRFGIGLDHIVNADWRLRPSVSANYDDGKETAAALRIDYTPSDHWIFGLFGDSFSTEVAGRARTAGIEADLFGADAVWRPSEWRQVQLGYTRSFFSDDNVRDEVSLGYAQNLWVKHDWRMRVFLDLYATWNSKGDQTVYFNPEQAWELSLTHMTEQTVWQLYPRSFVHRLYVSAGTYQQKGYGNDLVGSVRYEQEHAFSDCHELLVGIGLGRNVYDGEVVSDIRLDVMYQWRF